MAQVEVSSRRPRLADGLPGAEARRVAAILARCEAIELDRSGRLFRNALAAAALVAVEEGFVVLRASFSDPSRSLITCEAGPGRLALPPAPGEVLCALGPARLTRISPEARDELLTLPIVARRIVEQMTFTLGEKHEALAIFAQTRHVERVRGPLQLYELSLPIPHSKRFDRAAAARGRVVFNGAGRCANCHMPPTFSDAGWNLHTGEEICIDNFQSSRSPTLRYRTTRLRGLVAKMKGGFYHDGRFPTLMAVVDHYDSCFKLGLSARQKSDLVQYLRGR